MLGNVLGLIGLGWRLIGIVKVVLRCMGVTLKYKQRLILSCLDMGNGLLDRYFGWVRPYADNFFWKARLNAGITVAGDNPAFCGTTAMLSG